MNFRDAYINAGRQNLAKILAEQPDGFLCISEGTVNPFDLIPVFVNILDEVEALDERGLIDNDPEFASAMDACAKREEHLSFTSLNDILDEVVDIMDRIAPEGYYFGTSLGDAACFGYWPVE